MSEARLRTFVAVAETGSVRAAAQRLYVTESAVSAAVAALTRDIGVPLVERAGRGLRLTPAGTVYARYARQVLGLLEEGRAAARGEDAPGHGRLRLAAVTTAADQLLPGALASFRADWPEVELTVEVGPSRQVWSSLAAHEADLVLGGRPPAGMPAEIVALRDNELVVVAAPQVAAGFALDTTPWVMREPGSGTRATAEAYLAERDARPPQLVLGSNGAVIAGAAAGLGAALVSRDAVRAELADGRLVVIEAPSTPLHRPWHAVTGPVPTATTRLFAEHLLSARGWAPADSGGSQQSTASGRAHPRPTVPSTSTSTTTGTNTNTNTRPRKGPSLTTADRTYDIVLFGATGFTGELTAEYLAEHAGTGTRWALAGRNRGKLEAVRDRLAEIEPSCRDLELLHADSTDAASLRTIAESTRVVITTVGPYIQYGEPLVAACAAAGTDYVDLTGEPTFVDRMYVRHHREAQRTGARIVHACGFDSIPHDLGVYFTVQQLPEGVPIAVEGFVRGDFSTSGGTTHSAIGIMADLPGMVRAERERRAMEPQPSGRRARISRRPLPRTRVGDGWTLPMPTIDPQIVVRSAAALDRFGPDFSYGPYIAVKSAPAAAGMAAGMTGVMLAAQLPVTREWLKRRKNPGEGPDAQRRAESWFTVTFVGEGGGRRVVTEVSGGDPGYGETSKMLAESALCLAHDDLPVTSGQLTTAVAMGDALIERLQRAGIGFRVVSSTSTGS